MSQRLWAVIAILILISSCAPTTQATPISVIDNATSTPSPILTATRIALPTTTLTASTTPLPTIPTFTPTFDVSTIVTVTPAPKAECPMENPTSSAQIFSDEGNLNNTELAEKILDLLNQGIPKSKIIRELANSPTPGGTKPTEVEDLTNDGYLELIVQIRNGFAVYKCNTGKYEISLAKVDDFGIHFKHIISTQDMNLNGMPEVVVSTLACSGYGCLGIEIFEWNGYAFQSLIHAPIYDSSTGKIIEVSSSAGTDAPKV